MVLIIATMFSGCTDTENPIDTENEEKTEEMFPDTKSYDIDDDPLYKLVDETDESDDGEIAETKTTTNEKSGEPENEPVAQPAVAEELEDNNPKTYTNSIDMEFVLIPAGEFEMGSPLYEEDRYDNEGPVHEVTIGQAYYFGKYEVTQEQWGEVMGDNPSYFDGDSNPVEKVSWNDVQEFVKKLNNMEGTNKYRLPSEAEWEYACRAGTTMRYSFGDSVSDLGEYAWYKNNSGSKTHPVGQKKPNPWGLYDMHGNVWEWCQDGWHSYYEGAPTDGSAWEDGSGSLRVSRGGSWFNNAENCRSANRYEYAPYSRYFNFGFRLLREM
ncbi:formylglycine-generating enzyme family protein [Methanolobus sp. ZRKC4]|uniref:formylglycine-generating enzyme family protein n=1 Tax=Methanolobus sp. ZRKC4 TaxID=3125787 RepID=UPI0032567A81